MHLPSVSQKNGQQISKTVWWTAKYVHSTLKIFLQICGIGRPVNEAGYLTPWSGLIPSRSSL